MCDLSCPLKPSTWRLLYEIVNLSSTWMFVEITSKNHPYIECVFPSCQRFLDISNECSVKTWTRRQFDKGQDEHDAKGWRQGSSLSLLPPSPWCILFGWCDAISQQVLVFDVIRICPCVHNAWYRTPCLCATHSLDTQVSKCRCRLAHTWLKNAQNIQFHFIRASLPNLFG